MGLAACFSYNGFCFYRSMFIKRHGVQLGPQKQDVIPARHGHLGSHGCNDGLSLYSHLMNFVHIAGIGLCPGILRIIGSSLPCTAAAVLACFPGSVFFNGLLLFSVRSLGAGPSILCLHQLIGCDHAHGTDF